MMNGRTAPFRTQVVKKAKPVDREFNPWYWNPNRLGVELAPRWFEERLEEVSPDLRATRNPITRKWQIWTRNERFAHPICVGWRLLFVHDERLDERVLARVYAIDSTKNGGAKAYFDRIQSEIERDKAIREKDRVQENIDIAMDYGWDHSRIRVGYGQSNGSKFSKYHA